MPFSRRQTPGIQCQIEYAFMTTWLPHTKLKSCFLQSKCRTFVFEKACRHMKYNSFVTTYLIKWFHDSNLDQLSTITSIWCKYVLKSMYTNTFTIQKIIQLTTTQMHEKSQINGNSHTFYHQNHNETYIFEISMLSYI